MKKVIVYIFCFFSVLTAVTQNGLMNKQHYHDTYIPDAVVDERHGVDMYEKWNMMLGGDTVRNDRNGYAANGFIEDYYTTGQLLHKGFYVNGQLKVYKNYYPNGTLERNFRMVDLQKSKMDKFYDDDTQRSKIEYVGDKTYKWEDYYANGTLEFVEEYHKSLSYFIFKANYYENGNPESTLEIVDKKRLIFLQTDYYPSGEVKQAGEMKYESAKRIYKIGTWMEFDANGEPTREIVYENGKIQSETDL